MIPRPSTDLAPRMPLVLLGASTGGTRAIARILSLLPPLRASIVIVQHMPRFINESFARSLAADSANAVRLVRDGDVLAESTVFLAPSDLHCQLVGNRRLRLVPGLPVNYVCPAVDVTMQSVAPPAPGQRLVGILLTGMGRDGAQGMAHLKSLGALTVAQDAASCAVHGMPAEAVRLGCIDYELNPDAIARWLTGLPGFVLPGSRNPGTRR